MSSIPDTRNGRPVRLPGLAAPRLSVVPQSSARAPRVQFVVLVISVLAVGLVGLLILNTSMQRRAYVVTGLRTQAAQLTLRAQNLQVQVSRLESPERLAAVAAAAGMVRGDSPAFLSLATGKVVGVPRPGQPNNSVVLYAGRGSRSTSKLLPLPAGSRNNGSSGVQRKRRTDSLPKTGQRGQPHGTGKPTTSGPSARSGRSAR